MEDFYKYGVVVADTNGMNTKDSTKSPDVQNNAQENSSVHNGLLINNVAKNIGLSVQISDSFGEENPEVIDKEEYYDGENMY